MAWIERANEVWKSLLESYRPPPIDERIVTEVDRYIARRKEEIREHGVV